MRMGGGRFEGANPYASMLILQPSNLGRAASPLAASLIIQPYSSIPEDFYETN
jgi:hypothetical protein